MTGDPGAADPERTLPLMAGAARPEGLPEGAEGESRPRQGRRLESVLAVALILLIGGGSIYAMRLSQGELVSNQTNKSAQARVDTAIAKLGKPGSMNPNDPMLPRNLKGLLDVDAVVSWFSEDRVHRQVPVDQLKQDPFGAPQMVVVMSNPGQGNNGETRIVTSTVDTQHEELLKQIEMEAAGLRLDSTMPSGARPIAVINGKFYTLGQKVGSFTVKSITGRNAQVEALGKTFTLTIESGTNAPADGGILGGRK